MINSVSLPSFRPLRRSVANRLLSLAFAVTFTGAALAFCAVKPAQAEDKYPTLPHDPPPSAIVRGAAVEDQFGYVVAQIGDVNGDGFADAAVTARRERGPNTVYVLHGGPEGLPSGADGAAWQVEGDGANNQFGLVLQGGGDLNGDGYADLLVGAPASEDDERDAVYVFYGSDVGLQGSTATGSVKLTGPDASLEFDAAIGPPPGDGFGRGIASLGDVNGDGYDDVAIGAPGANYNSGAIYLFHGGPGGLSSTPHSTIEGYGGDTAFGGLIAAAGDVNGDGYADLATTGGLGAYGGGKLYAFYGSPEGITGAPPHDAGWSVTSRDVLGLALIGAGDVNGDGYDDLAATSFRLDRSQEKDNFLVIHADEPGTLLIFYGSAAGLSGTPSEPSGRVVGEIGGDRFGSYLAAAGDVNGDGYDDLAVTTANTRVPALDRNVSNSDQIEAERAAGIVPALGKLYVLMGSAQGLAGQAGAAEYIVTGGLQWHNVPYPVAAGGDLDGDGRPDVLAGVSSAGNYAGEVYVFTGGAITAGAGVRAEGSAGVQGREEAAGEAAGELSAGEASSLADLRPAARPDSSSPSDPAGTETGTGARTESNSESNLESDAAAGTEAATAQTGTGPGADDDQGQSADLVPTEPAKLPPPVTTDVEVFPPNGDALGELPLLAAAAGDLNGDGRPDLIVGAGDYEEARGRIYLFYGRGDMVDAPREPDATITGAAAGDALGRGLAVADFNGDGYADLAAGIPGHEMSSGQVAIYDGGAGGLAATGGEPTPARLLAGEYPNNNFGLSIAAAGDVNGDGYADLAVGAYGYDSTRGKVYVYHGGPDGLGAEAVFVAVGEDVSFLHRGVAIEHNLGNAVAGAGDVNGDGYADLLVAAASYGVEDETRQQGKIYLFEGSAEGLTGTTAEGKIVDPAFTAIGEQSFELLGSALAGGDLNGDGYSDAVVGSNYTYAAESGRVYLFYGSAAGLGGQQKQAGAGSTAEAPAEEAANGTADGAADGTANGTAHGAADGTAAGRAALMLTGLAIGDYGAEETLGAALAVDDFDGDGYADIAAGAPKSDAWRGKVHLLRGGPQGVEASEPGPYPSESSVIRAGVGSDMFGLPLISAGDVDGDGRPEIAAGAAFGRQGWGQIYMFDGDQ
jgi:hypothetical protein